MAVEGCKPDKCKGEAAAAEIDVTVLDPSLRAQISSVTVTLTLNGVLKGSKTLGRSDLPFVLIFTEAELQGDRSIQIEATALDPAGKTIAAGSLPKMGFSPDACNFFSIPIGAVTPPVDGGADAQDGPRTDASRPDHGTTLPCDPGFSFNPVQLETGRLVAVYYETTVKGYSNIALQITGPGTAQIADGPIVSYKTPWKWSWVAALDQGGTWTLTFSGDQPSRVIATCQRAVKYTTPPPALPTPACVCGDNGGACKTCPMRNDFFCLDPPAPVRPAGSGSGTWNCLDNATCSDGHNYRCRIWCPGEPCNTALHPDGCPVVEACFVDPHPVDYEEACRQCCRTPSLRDPPNDKEGCWDDALNLCRHVGDCGKAYP
jgi:hypothetical protein